MPPFLRTPTIDAVRSMSLLGQITLASSVAGGWLIGDVLYNDYTCRTWYESPSKLSSVLNMFKEPVAPRQLVSRQEDTYAMVSLALFAVVAGSARVCRTFSSPLVRGFAQPLLALSALALVRYLSFGVTFETAIALASLHVELELDKIRWTLWFAVTITGAACCLILVR